MLLDKHDVLCMDSSFRSFVLSNYEDIVSFQREVSRVSFFDDVDEDYKMDLYNRLEFILNDTTLSKIYSEAEKINLSYYSRTRRLKARISKILTFENCYFCTFTFDDKSLGLKASTRRQYVSRFLNSYCTDYVANIDFGSKNGREHYHSVCCSFNQDFVLDANLNYKMGFCYIKPIVRKCESSLAKYISKLTNHSLKSTTKNSKIIYKRY